MTTTTSSTAAASRSRIADAASGVQRERLFYVVAASLSLVVALTGFRYFYFGGSGFLGNPLTPQVLTVIYVHAFVMSSWILLFLAQNLLVYSGRLRWHMTLGWIGIAFAIAIIVLGATIAVLSAHHNPKAYEMFGGPRFFLVEMLTQVLLFACLFPLGIVVRRRAELHRPIMLAAMTVILAGALARCPLLDFLAATPPLYSYGPVILFGLLLLAIHWFMTGAFNRWYAFSLAGITAVFILSIPLGHSGPWQRMLEGYIQ